MRRRRLWVILLMALASGGGAGYLALQYLRQARVSGGRPVPQLQVLVAARDLPMGALLDEADLKLLDWPGEVLPSGYVSSQSAVVGRGILVPIYANEPVLLSKLGDKEGGGGLSVVIPPGMRAVSVKVDEVIGVAGFVIPGTRVDVLVTLNLAVQREAATRIVLQNVETLAAGQSIQRDPGGNPQAETVITLLVTPQQAEKLTLAATTGKIQLALRNTLDLAEVETPGISATSLLNPARDSRPARPRRLPRPTVELLKGSERSVTTVR